MHKIENCNTPRTIFRRINSVWSCPTCGNLFALRYSVGLIDYWKEWKKLDGEQ